MKIVVCGKGGCGKSTVTSLLARACLKKAFCKMCVTICGRFCPDEGGAVYFPTAPFQN